MSCTVHILDIYQEYTRYILGILQVYSRYIPGIFLVYSWYILPCLHPIYPRYILHIYLVYIYIRARPETRGHQSETRFVAGRGLFIA